MNYLKKSFTVGMGSLSKSFADRWEQTFGKKESVSIWCPVHGDNGCRYAGDCIGSKCLAAERSEGSLLNKQTR